MNILFLYGGVILPQRGGVERVTAVLADEFTRRGNGVFYLSLPVFTTDCESDLSRQSYLPNSVFGSQENIRFFKDFLERKKIDIVINQGGNGQACSRLAYVAKEVGVSIISVCHCGLIDSAKNYRAIHEMQWKRRKFGWLLPLTDSSLVKKLFLALYKKKYQAHYQELCRKSDKVVLLSESFKAEMAFYFDGKCPENVVVIPNPCSFPPPEKPISMVDKQKELLFVGRIDFSPKRVDLMLKIWGKLFRQFSDWRLTIVGGGCALEDAKRMALKMKLERVSFEGFQDPRPYYERASIFCMTSAWETFGLVLIEAMNYGCVPVAFDSYASVRDIIDTGKNGFLVPPMNCCGYVEILEKLMCDSFERRVIGNCATEKAKVFSISEVINLWEQEILGRVTSISSTVKDK